jgi:hypothetical protein
MNDSSARFIYFSDVVCVLGTVSFSQMGPIVRVLYYIRLERLAEANTTTKFVDLYVMKKMKCCERPGIQSHI